ncbi:MAG: aminotransferase class III-fold pyridoxal phosphate-dependent enzyme [Alphaproteobacteria bacterium]|nr:aminotransferase class III-fold pyridoxal phosphate-dependent enzyme [Alphaproteobacteria bacterium]
MLIRNAIDDVRELDRRYVFHPFTALADHQRDGAAFVVTSAHGARLTDTDGRDYVDAMAGLWCVNVGYGRARIGEAMAQQATQLSYCHGFSGMTSDTPAILSQRLIELAPPGMARVFYGNSGSDANDTQVKLAWYYNNILGRPHKKKIIARHRGYHGVTVMTAGMTGLSGLHAGFDLPLPMIRHAMAPRRLWEGHGLSDAEFTARLVADLEALIAAEGADTIAAMIMEPLMGAGGVLAPPAGYYAAVQEILRRHDILLIADEVICGFGRLGQMFGSTVFGIQPDLMTVAKGLTSAYFPLSACIVSERVWDVIVAGGAHYGAFGHGYTYSSHPVGAAAALANLDIIAEEGLVARAADMGAHLQAQLRAAFADHPLVGEVRGQALIAAVEFVDHVGDAGPVAFDPALKVAPRIVKAALKRGVISRALPSADTLAFSPPFVISRDEIDTAVAAVRDAADEVAAELGR